MAVQSSSITTSTIVPLVGAGVVSLEQAFPFTVGANLGTTVTAMLAALQTGSRAAIVVACSHLLFNLAGMMLIYVPPPIRRIPLALSRRLADLAVRRRGLALLYMIGLFYLLPFGLLLASGAFGDDQAAKPPQVQDGASSPQE